MAWSLLSNEGNADRDLSDAELLDRLRKTRLQRYARLLLERYTHLVFSFCYQILRNRDEAREASTRVVDLLVSNMLSAEIRVFRNYVFSMCRTVCLEAVEKQLRSSELTKEYLMAVEAQTQEPLTVQLLFDSGREHDKHMLVRSLSRLQEDDRSVLEWFYRERKSYAEIAEKLNETRNKVKSRLYNSRKALLNKLQTP